MDKYSIRKANINDMRMLYEWANDEKVRENAFSTEHIAWDVHQRWFLNKLESEVCDIFILYVDSIPVGQVRLDYEGEKAYIDYSIAKEHRGKGYAKIMLELVEKKVADNQKGIWYLEAEVKYDNQDSRKQFDNLSYDSMQVIKYRKCIK